MSDEDLVKRLRNTTIAIQPIFPTLRHEAADAIERLTLERDEARAVNAAPSEFDLKVMAERDAAERKVEVLREALEPYAPEFVEFDGMVQQSGNFETWMDARAALAETETKNVVD